jgi:hypothetical protein
MRRVRKAHEDKGSLYGDRKEEVQEVLQPPARALRLQAVLLVGPQWMIGDDWAICPAAS